MKMVVNLDLNKLQLQNAVLHPLGAAPSTPPTGMMYFDTTLGPRWFDGSAWTNKATDSALLGGSALATVLARGSHTGTQTAGTISDLATVVQGYSLSSFAVPTVDLALNAKKITGLADPTDAQDAATKAYVDLQTVNSAAGIDAKPSVRLASTANQALSDGTAFPTIDGVVTAAGDRVLLKNQTTTSENGPYVVGGSAGAWTLTRSTEGDANGELTPGAFWYVEEGTANGKTQWRIENTGTIVVGTTAITINQFGGAATAYTAGNGITLAANAFSVNAKASGGITVAADGVSVDAAIVARKFSVTIGDGAANPITVTHNLNTQDVIVSVREVSTNAVVIADVVANGVNTITVGFAVTPTANQYRVTVLA